MTRTLVQKYGGTSVGSVELIQRVAEKVAAVRARGERIAVVVSAMGDHTDRLVDLAAGIAREPNPREMDVLLATGELTWIVALYVPGLMLAPLAYTQSVAGAVSLLSSTPSHGTLSSTIAPRPLNVPPPLFVISTVSGLVSPDRLSEVKLRRESDSRMRGRSSMVKLWMPPRCVPPSFRAAARK